MCIVKYKCVCRRLFVILVRAYKRRFTGEVMRKAGNVYLENKATWQSKSREDDKLEASAMVGVDMTRRRRN